MTYEQIWKSLNELSVNCGMNQRYYQHFMSKAALTGECIDIAVVIFTLISLVLAVMARYLPEAQVPVFPNWSGPGNQNWTPVRLRLSSASLIASVLAAVSAIVLIVSPASEREDYHSTRFAAWTDLRIDTDAAIVDCYGVAQDEEELKYLTRRYRDLQAKYNRLNGTELSVDQDFLSQCLLAEERSRGLVDDNNDASTKTHPVPSEN